MMMIMIMMIMMMMTINYNDANDFLYITECCHTFFAYSTFPKCVTVCLMWYFVHIASV